MNKLYIKHEMDNEVREMSLDEIFLEALQLSESRTTNIEEQEYALFEYLTNFPNFIVNITDEYKNEVLEGWNYKIVDAK